MGLLSKWCPTYPGDMSLHRFCLYPNSFPRVRNLRSACGQAVLQVKFMLLVCRGFVSFLHKEAEVLKVVSHPGKRRNRRREEECEEEGGRRDGGREGGRLEEHHAGGGEEEESERMKVLTWLSAGSLGMEAALPCPSIGRKCSLSE